MTPEIPSNIRNKPQNVFVSLADIDPYRSKRDRKSTGRMNNKVKSCNDSAYFGESNIRLRLNDIEFSDDEDPEVFETVPKRQTRPVPPLVGINKIRTEAPVPHLNPISKVAQNILGGPKSFLNGHYSISKKNPREEIAKQPDISTSIFGPKNNVEPRHYSVLNRNSDLQSRNSYQDLLKKLIPQLYTDSKYCTYISNSF